MRNTDKTDLALAALRELVLSILKRPLDGGREWSLQGLGMLRLYLSPEIRLHIWSSRHRSAPNVSKIHDHPWHLESLVLSGRVRNVTYEIYGDGPQSLATHYEGRIVCGPRPKRRGVIEAPRLVSIYVDDSQDYDEKAHRDYCPGYRLSADSVHETEFDDGTVTVVRRTQAVKSSEHAFVYWPMEDGVDGWISAEPRPATAEEVREICALALERWTFEEKIEVRT